MDYYRRLKLITRLLIKKLSYVRILEVHPDNMRIKYKLKLIDNILQIIKRDG